MSFFTKKNQKILKKPSWIKIKLPTNYNYFNNIKTILNSNNIKTVCEEAKCPNLIECFNNKTATFMILGKICTRRCSFCNVIKGYPYLIDFKEPEKLAKIIQEIKLKYVVITSVNRDDLYDGGAKQFLYCIKEIKTKNINTKIEILVPDFRHCMPLALSIINIFPPDVFSHNIESIPRLYKKIRPGANYVHSLNLLKQFKKNNPYIPTKSGLMLGLGEKENEIIKVMHDLYNHGVTILTIGQYLQPSIYHLPVKHYVNNMEFEDIKKEAKSIGFTNITCGTFVRSSYQAINQI